MSENVPYGRESGLYKWVDPSEPVAFINVIPEKRTPRLRGVFNYSPYAVENQKALVLEDRMESMHITSERNKLPILEMTLFNEDQKLLGSPIVVKGTIVEVRWGYVGYMGKTRKFKVSKVRGVDHRSKVYGKVRVTCVGLLSSLNTTKKCRKFVNVRPYQVAEHIAKEYGFSRKNSIIGRQNPPASPQTFTQQNQTDAQFLSTIAKKLGWVFKVDNETFVFAPRDKMKKSVPIRHYTYWHDEDGWIISFEPESTVFGVAGTVRVRSRDPKKCVPIAVAVNPFDRVQASMGKNTPLRSARPKKNETTDCNCSKKQKSLLSKPKIHRSKKAGKPGHEISSLDVGAVNRNKKQVKKEAQVRQAHEQMRVFAADVRQIGDPDLWDEELLSYDGIGYGLDGFWRISRVVHRIDRNGYTVEMKIRTDAVDLSSQFPGKKTVKKNNTMGKPRPKIKKDTDLKPLKVLKIPTEPPPGKMLNAQGLTIDEVRALKRSGVKKKLKFSR